ncbi:hypothetical protein CEUSTIGMA_g13547.t1 [Chlamydomonas eustigma]|uniref:Uncharacterized protein n=1 Tax=Chlamydomonas eustigma TaxID=1157962 RepID=A0A250XST7_9CHLO|nr:hypothetical protein CEUSTIGMA_g13547.t1 [Chlamydomonas eustigma]|eukprot:GAX86134.1 hypothetical protein CEUSTIGMA_g13547.t1 [Chlamydomonas eustigma]
MQLAGSGILELQEQLHSSVPLKKLKVTRCKVPSVPARMSQRTAEFENRKLTESLDKDAKDDFYDFPPAPSIAGMPQTSTLCASSIDVFPDLLDTKSHANSWFSVFMKHPATASLPGIDKVAEELDSNRYLTDFFTPSHIHTTLQEWKDGTGARILKAGDVNRCMLAVTEYAEGASKKAEGMKVVLSSKVGSKSSGPIVTTGPKSLLSPVSEESGETFADEDGDECNSSETYDDDELAMEKYLRNARENMLEKKRQGISKEGCTLRAQRRLQYIRAQARKAILECSAFKGTMEERVEQYTAMLYVVHPLHATKPEEGKDVPDSDVARKIVKEIHGKAHGISCIKLLEKQKKKEERKAMKTDDQKKRNKDARRLRK